MAKVVMEHVYKRYQHGVFVLQDCSLQLPEKELAVLLGGADSGKTTFLKLLAGIEHASMGEVYLDGQLIHDRMRGHGDIAMVFQRSSLYPNKTVYENIAFNLKKKKLSREEIRERAVHAAEVMEVEKFLDVLPGHLSQGQRQLVMMARAMARRPKLVLIDDPLSGILDPWSGPRHFPTGHSLLDKVRLLYEQLDATVIYATRDIGEAWNLDQKVILLQEGRIVQIGDLRELYEHPVNDAVKEYLDTPEWEAKRISGGEFPQLSGKLLAAVRNVHI